MLTKRFAIYNKLGAIEMSSFPVASKASRSIGAMFLFAFGGAWLALWAYADFRSPWLPIAAIALATAMLFGYASRVYQRNKPALAALKGTPQQRRKSKWFNIINAAQWSAIFVLGNVLSRFGLSQYIIPMIIGVIGLHFLPLATLFSYRPHYLTGALLITWPLLYAPMHGPESNLGPLGAGIVLWCSAAWAIWPKGARENGT
ncbi:MAG TPA: hypothetical protein VJ603_05530 [Paucimonas sp.]|nr:hypothetical protein [Paucimonas sp.]HJW54491.1 hypothetical protein [Burkholderiaceae bacterium]